MNKPPCVADEAKIEALAMADCRFYEGKEVLVDAISGFVGNDSVDITLDQPARVKIEPTSEQCIKRWIDGWCDPIYEVSLAEPHHQLSDVRSMWIHGPSRHVDGKRIEKSDILQIAERVGDSATHLDLSNNEVTACKN